MAIVERDILLGGKDDSGNQTMDFPITRLGNVEDSADVKAAPDTGDYIPVMDSAAGGQMKKTPVSAVVEAVKNAPGGSGGVQANLDIHVADGVKHITAAERSAWNGKAAGNHTHPGYAPSSHNHPASNISAGTFAGAVKAKDDTAYTTYKLRNAALVSAVPASMANGTVAFVYS